MSYEGELLKELIDEDFGIEHDTGDYWRAVKHDSLVLDLPKGIFYWNSKDIAGSVAEYYKYVRGEKPPTKFLLRESAFTLALEPEKKEEVHVYPPLVDAYWKLGKQNRQYWYDRLLTDTTIDRFKLGYNNGWYSLPIYKDGDFYNIQYRRDEPEKGVSLHYKRPPFLFNSAILPIVSEVIFTEGIVDAILLSQMGFPAVSKNTGAGGWFPEWIRYFISIDTIYMLFDNDEAGEKGMAKGSDIFGAHRCKGYTFSDFAKKGYDVVDYFRDGHTKEELTDLLGMARMVY